MSLSHRPVPLEPDAAGMHSPQEAMPARHEQQAGKMTVYVDQERNQFGRMVMCHMFADTIQELYDMADAIGMRRMWYQPLSFPHYDVSLLRRKLALEKGAVEVTRREGHEIRKRLRVDPEFLQHWKQSYDERAGR